MRLIDADALLCAFEPFRDMNGNPVILRLDTVIAVLNSMSTIDAEHVVRCKDCQHWGTGYGGETDNIKVCEYANYMVGKNGYCVYGERKMDPEVQDD